MDYLSLLTSSFGSLNEKVFLRKTYLEKLKQFTDTQQIIVVEGQRRSWKSYTILWFIQFYDIKEKTFYFNAEFDIKKNIKTASDLSNLFDAYCEKNGNPEWIIIDEIQDIQDWENFIRAKYASKQYKIIISWSNAYLLSWELATFLSGRYLSFYICPFWFDEYQEMIDFYALKKDRSFVAYMQTWGLPEVIRIEDTTMQKNYVKAVINTILVKDIFFRLGKKQTKDSWLFLQLLAYLSNIVGSIVSVKNIVETLQKEQGVTISLPTFSHYMQEILASYLIHKVPRYNILGKCLFQQKDKYYFNDLWIRNSFRYDSVYDKGKILENIVFLHLKRLWYEIYVGENETKEIDFVIKKDNLLQYLQVAWTLEWDQVKEREFWNLLSIRDAYPKHLVSFDSLWKWDHQGIIVRNIETFLKEFK